MTKRKMTVVKVNDSVWDTQTGEDSLHGFVAGKPGNYRVYIKNQPVAHVSSWEQVQDAIGAAS